jgi:hypothetical protein
MEVGKLLDLAGVAEKQNPRPGKKTRSLESAQASVGETWIGLADTSAG